MNRRVLIAVACSLALLSLMVALPTTSAADFKVEKHIVGETLGGRPIECNVYGDGDGDDVFWLIATIHGNEAAGTPIAKKFVEWLEQNPKEVEGRKIVVMPVANPDGFADNVRFNRNGVDLNRNFPAGNWGEADVKPHGATPLSEPESRVLMRVLCQYFPNRVVSIHQPLNCVDWDGPADKMAEAMAAKCKLPLNKLGSRPGSLGSFVGTTLGRPIITLELPADAGMDEEVLWNEYGEAIIAALRYKHEEPAVQKTPTP